MRNPPWVPHLPGQGLRPLHPMLRKDAGCALLEGGREQVGALEMTPLKLVGGFGSPYSRKMRAVMRFRRIPFTWIMRGSAEDVDIPSVPVALISVLVFPGEGGRADEAMIDLTFQIKRLEKLF